MKRRQIILVLLALALSPLACTSVDKKASAREPQSTPGLLVDLLKLKTDIASNAVDAQNCHEYFQSQLQALQEERLQEIPFERAKHDSEKIMHATWQNRLAIHAGLSKYVSCRTELRQLFYRLRSIEDLAADRFYGEKQTTQNDLRDFQNQPIPLVDNDFYHGYLGSSGAVEKATVPFRSGDLMVTRGLSFFSAALSMIPDHPSQLDHFVLVHRDNTGKMQTIESYAQTGGVAAFPMDYALKNENARIMLLRPKDAALGAKAAQIMLDAVEEGERNPSKKIGYDFFMDLENPERMTCSAVTYWGFRRASNDEFKIPEEKSTVSPKLSQIFENTGIKQGPLLTAGDIELDTRFELLLEFRDPRLIQDGRIREVVEQSIFKWMKEYNYRLRPTLGTIAIDTLIYPLRPTKLWPVVRKVTGSPDFPLETPKGFIKTLKQLNDVSDVLYKRVYDATLKNREKTGWGLTQQQMLDVLDQYRVEDLKNCNSRGGGYAHFTSNFGAVPCSTKR
ncbi:hypothetical protein BH10BDE1_BH10BDE1_13630 [soil metagenome]